MVIGIATYTRIIYNNNNNNIRLRDVYIETDRRGYGENARATG